MNRLTTGLVFGVVAALVIVNVYTVSLGQEEPKARTSVRGLLELIKVRGVYDDLEVVDFQKEAIDKALAEMQAASRDVAAGLRQASPEERNELIARFRAASAKAESEILAILLPAQIDRLKQIRMNIVANNDGATFGLKNREFLEWLELTDKQKAEIDAKAADVNKAVEEKIKKLQAEIVKLKLEARDEVIKILTPEQRARYLELVGRPFEEAARK